MGTWAIPQTPKQAKKLQKLMAKPLSPKEAINTLYNLLGDDDLFDLILAEEEKFGTDCDVRIVVKKSLKEFLDNQENTVEPWNEEAYKICQNICK